MQAWWVETLPVVLLALVLFCAIVRPYGVSEATAAVPAAVLLVAAGVITTRDALGEVAQLAPVVGFLAVILVFAQLCDAEGLFRACGSWLARSARGSPQRLLVLVFVAASLVTAVLSLDATVVLLTPVVFATARWMGSRPAPYAYACAHLANSASLLLPVSNLTNLLAFDESGLDFLGFTALMALPWMVAIGVEYLALRWYFSADTRTPEVLAQSAEQVRPPVFVLVTVGCTLVGFVVTSALGLGPVWAAAAGTVVLGARALARRRISATALVRSVSLPFLAFVLALGVLVRAVVDGGLGDLLARLLPAGSGLATLLAVALIAAVLANLINNLPAVLVLLPLVAPSGAGVVLAMLIGVNLGPNLTYAGSLATLLWRRVVQREGDQVRLGEFTRLGLLTVPVGVVAAVLALWVSLTVLPVG